MYNAADLLYSDTVKMISKWQLQYMKKTTLFAHVQVD